MKNEKKKLKILILSCNTGEGHNMAARAVCERCEAEGHDAEVVDYLSLHSKWMSRFISGFYLGLAKYFPHVFGFFYNGMGLLSRAFPTKRSSVYLANLPVAKKLRAFIEKGQYDAIVFTHMFGAEALTRLKRKGIAVPPSVMILTDYTCYPHLEETDCDAYILPHEELHPIFEKRGFAPERLYACGIPTGMRFQNMPTRAEARAALGLSAQEQIYLVMGGSMGAGHIRSFTKRLSEQLENGRVIVICGRNEKLKRSLENHFAKTHPNVVIVGFTTEIPRYMAACDVLYTKPGGLTSTEALVCHTPTVCTKPIPGCESDNMRFFCRNGIAIYAKTVSQKLECGKQLAENAEAQAQMQEKQAQIAKPNASLDIVRLVERLCEERVTCGNVD